ncbi:KptA family-domain-containing protein [Crepidotus variabilis]|uniref:2'-phosphotransferase n=1 Tax=Crepidotus variabilis TaxID=179855 RepID=A0A9P6JJV0_9AGAR|nr:KptA family-domain-containing protein [Crepidotus variabilis]
MFSKWQKIFQKRGLLSQGGKSMKFLIVYQAVWHRSPQVAFVHSYSFIRRMDKPQLQNPLSDLSISRDQETSSSRGLQTSAPSNAKGKAKAKPKGAGRQHPPKGSPSQSSKLRGMDKDSTEVRVSKTLTWLLRHGAQNEGLHMRADGCVRVTDILNHPKVKSTGLDLEALELLVKSNDKQRYDLICETREGVVLDTTSPAPVAVPAVEVGAEGSSVQSPEVPPSTKGIWWIRARQGHSIKEVKLELKPILSLKDIPTGIAVHGTNREAWKIISQTGLSKMKRNHIHIAQDVAGQNVVSGMRTSSQILIYIDITKAIDAGIKFWLSDNGVILTEGNEDGYLARRYFQKVVDLRHGELQGWEE